MLNNPNNPNNPNRFIVFLFLALAFLLSFSVSAYASECPVSVTSFIQAEDNSSSYQLTYTYEGVTYTKVINNVKNNPLLYYWGGKIFVQSCPTDAFINSTDGKFYRTSKGTTSSTTVISCSFEPNSTSDIFSVSSKSTDAGCLNLSDTTFLYSSYDIIDSSTGEPFFPNPPQWTILTGVPILSPLAQVVGLIPTVLFWVVLYLSLRKGLSQLLMVLQKA